MEAELGAETLMMRVETGCYFSVQGSAQFIWAAIDGKRSVGDIVDLLMERYEVDRAACEAQTIDFLKQLAAQDLVASH